MGAAMSASALRGAALDVEGARALGRRWPTCSARLRPRAPRPQKRTENTQRSSTTRAPEKRNPSAGACLQRALRQEKHVWIPLALRPLYTLRLALDRYG